MRKMAENQNGDVEKMLDEAKKQKKMVVKVITAAVNIVLKYYFLALLVFIGYLTKIKNAIMEPLEPIAETSRKVPEKDISLHGIVRTLTRLVFLVGLMWWTVVKSIFDKVNPFPGFWDKFMHTAKSYAEKDTPKIVEKTS